MASSDKSGCSRGHLSLGWQVVLLTVCIFSHKLTNSYGPSLAEALGFEYEHGQRRGHWSVS